MAKPVKEEYDVTVLSRREVAVFPKLGQEVFVIRTTYVAAGLPPWTVEIDKAKWTIDVEKRLIREDIQRRLKLKPEVYKV